jgi:hypothetical protein
MAERHADQIATRLGIADAQTFRALRQNVLNATRGAQAVAVKKVAPPELARSRARDSDIEREMLAGLLEYPELLEDDALADALNHVEGEVAVAIAALHRAREEGIGPLELLERIPKGLSSLVAERLASPRLPDVDAARALLLSNAGKLHKLRDKEHARDVLEQLHHAAQSGDVERQTALLAERVQRARARRGLKD